MKNCLIVAAHQHRRSEKTFQCDSKPTYLLTSELFTDGLVTPLPMWNPQTKKNPVNSMCKFISFIATRFIGCSMTKTSHKLFICTFSIEFFWEKNTVARQIFTFSSRHFSRLTCFILACDYCGQKKATKKNWTIKNWTKESWQKKNVNIKNVDKKRWQNNNFRQKSR